MTDGNGIQMICKPLSQHGSYLEAEHHIGIRCSAAEANETTR
jgi:hypothetical protein